MAGLRRSGTGLRWACGVLVAAGLAHGAFWLSSVHRLDTLVEEQAQVLRGRGWRVVLGAAWPQGWPASAGLRFGPTSIEADGFAWHADRVVVDAALRWPWSMSGRPPGTAHVQAEGQRLRFGSGTDLAIPSQNVQAEVSGDTVTLAGTGVGIAQVFEAGSLHVRLGPDGMALAARRVKLLGSARVDGPVADTLALHASATPSVSLAGDLRAAATAWRGAGGLVDVSDVTVVVGRARALGKGRLWLDDALQPRLEGTMHVTGYEAGLDELAAAGGMARQTVLAARAVLGLLAAPALDGGADVPVEIAAGVLTVAHFPLLRVPVLEWPSATPKP